MSRSCRQSAFSAIWSGKRSPELWNSQLSSLRNKPSSGLWAEHLRGRFESISVTRNTGDSLKRGTSNDTASRMYGRPSTERRSGNNQSYPWFECVANLDRQKGEYGTGAGLRLCPLFVSRTERGYGQGLPWVLIWSAEKGRHTGRTREAERVK